MVAKPGAFCDAMVTRKKGKPTLISLVTERGLMRHLLEGDEATANATILAEGGTAIEGAAALVLYLPARLIGGVASSSRVR